MEGFWDPAPAQEDLRAGVCGRSALVVLRALYSGRVGNNQPIVLTRRIESKERGRRMSDETSKGPRRQ
jgi:hypothetical protein